MHKQTNRPISFRRSFLFSLAIYTFVLPPIIWIAQGNRSATWPLRAWVIFFSLPFAAIGLFAFGLFASEERIERAVRIPPSGGGLFGLFFTILAAPVYYILRARAERKRR
jgi:hypothetical protein